MIRAAIITSLLISLASPVLAEEAPTARPNAGRAAAPPPDLSRSVTLTGNELRLLIASQVAQAQASAAAEAAQDATRKVNEAMTPPAEPAK